MEGYPSSGDEGRERFVRALNLNRLQDAWEVAARMQLPEMWEQLAHRAMTHMEIESAIRVYRFVGDASMVMSLERLEHIEDKNMLAGNILVLFERDECYDTAQELFVRAGRPREALQMRDGLAYSESYLPGSNVTDMLFVRGSVGAAVAAVAGAGRGVAALPRQA